MAFAKLEILDLLKNIKLIKIKKKLKINQFYLLLAIVLLKYLMVSLMIVKLIFGQLELFFIESYLEIFLFQ